MRANSRPPRLLRSQAEMDLGRPVWSPAMSRARPHCGERGGWVPHPAAGRTRVEPPSRPGSRPGYAVGGPAAAPGPPTARTGSAARAAAGRGAGALLVRRRAGVVHEAKGLRDRVENLGVRGRPGDIGGPVEVDDDRTAGGRVRVVAGQADGEDLLPARFGQEPRRASVVVLPVPPGRMCSSSRSCRARFSKSSILSAAVTGEIRARACVEVIPVAAVRARTVRSGRPPASSSRRAVAEAPGSRPRSSIARCCWTPAAAATRLTYAPSRSTGRGRGALGIRGGRPGCRPPQDAGHTAHRGIAPARGRQFLRRPTEQARRTGGAAGSAPGRETGPGLDHRPCPGAAGSSRHPPTGRLLTLSVSAGCIGWCVIPGCCAGRAGR